jgi:hypothetical protein
MMREVESAGTLANPLKLNAFLDALTKSITVDAGMSTADMAKLALQLKGLSTGNVVLTTLPLSGFQKIDGVDVDMVDHAKAAALFDSLAHPAPESSAPPSAPSVPATQVHVRVFNGAGVSGLAARASADLAKLGFVLDGQPANRGTGAATSIVEYPPALAGAAHTRAAAVPGAVLKADPQLSGHLELVLGSSYHGAKAPGSVTGGSSAAGTTAGTTPGQTTAADDTCTA